MSDNIAQCGFLTIHPAAPAEPQPMDPGFSWDKWREWSDDDRRRFQQRRAQRFTGAELAAEGYRQSLRACAESGLAWDEDGGANIIVLPQDALTFGPVRVETSRLAVMNRFAMLPHASAGDYQ